MDLYYKQELTVGGLVLVAAVILVAGLLWLTGRSVVGGGRVAVDVEFSSVNGLTEGDPVHISGVSVGRVASVHLEDVGRVLVRLEVNSDVRPHTDAQAAVRSLDFLGAKYVAYTPGTASDFLPADEVVTGVQETELIESATALTQEATKTLVATQRLLNGDLAERVGRAMEATERAMAVVARVGQGPLTDSLTATLGAIQGAARALDSTLMNPGLQESLSQLDEVSEGVTEMTQGLAAMTENLAGILQLMQSPEGSLGKALTDTTLYNDVHEVLVSLKLLLDDVRERPGRYINVSVF